jgi:hypothetical protein
MNAPRLSPRRASIHFVAAAVVAITAAAWNPDASAQSQPPAAQSSAERGVTVRVTPKAVGPAKEWEFAVVLDTHSAELNDDLVNTAVLLADGNELRPLSWAGAGPGGHHREGVLKFPAPSAAPQAVELRIQRAGETAARLFRWDGAALR